MRYADVLRQYLDVRAATSREWRISPTLVMCAELEVSHDTFQSIAFAENSQRVSGPVRLTFFRETDGGWTIAPTSVTNYFAISSDEAMAISTLRAQVSDWVMGRRDELPASTSTEMSDRLHRRR